MCESTQVLESEIHCNIIVNTHTDQNAEMDLHSRHANEENPVGQDNSSLSEGALELIEKSTQLLGLVNAHPGDYTGREIDIRTKQRPSRNDIDNINRAVTQLMSQNSISPIDNPFGYLWLANCVLYSTVAAFLLLKGCKKPRAQGEPRKNSSDKSKKVFEELAMELRRKISMAKAELERLRENRKLTKRGKRNRPLLLRECRVISAAELVSYMEKKKSQLRKLRTQRIREVRNEEARSLNQQFTQDTKQVNAKFA